MMKHLVPILLLMTLISCPKPPDVTDDRDTSIFIELIEAWTTSITLKISVADSSDIWSFALERNDSTIILGNSFQSNTVLVDTTVQMGMDYAYKAYLVHSGIRVDSTEIIYASTIGVTTHEVQWNVDTLGLPGSRLLGVDLVAEDNIWVSGELLLPDPDSSYNGSGKEPFNVAHWDGAQWSFLKSWSVDRRYSIQYFSENDIWVTSAAFPMHWDGSEWELFQLEHMGLDIAVGHDIWAQDNHNIFFVGYNGSIVKYESSTFIELNTEGEFDYKSADGNGQNLLVTGLNGEAGYSQLSMVSLASLEVEEIYSGPTILSGGIPDAYAGPLSAVTSIDANRFLLTSQYGLYLFDDRYPAQVNLIPYNPNNLAEYFPGFPRAVDGTGFNNVFIVGDYASVFHFNGEEFYHYPNQISFGRYRDVDVKDDLVVIVGSDYDNGRAVVLKGNKR